MPSSVLDKFIESLVYWTAGLLNIHTRNVLDCFSDGYFKNVYIGRIWAVYLLLEISPQEIITRSQVRASCWPDMGTWSSNPSLWKCIVQPVPHFCFKMWGCPILHQYEILCILPCGNFWPHLGSKHSQVPVTVHGFSYDKRTNQLGWSYATPHCKLLLVLNFLDLIMAVVPVNKSSNKENSLVTPKNMVQEGWLTPDPFFHMFCIMKPSFWIIFFKLLNIMRFPCTIV